jgi:hypothetical protein
MQTLHTARFQKIKRQKKIKEIGRGKPYMNNE